MTGVLVDQTTSEGQLDPVPLPLVSTDRVFVTRTDLLGKQVTYKGSLDNILDWVADNLAEVDLSGYVTISSIVNTLTSTANNVPAAANTVKQLKDLIDSVVAMIGALSGNGIAPLLNGLIPSQFLPSYVDDILEYANLASFPLVGEKVKIYSALDTNLFYRWSGSTYALIGDGTTIDVISVGSNAFARYDITQALTDADKSRFLANVGAKRSGNLINKTASYTLGLSDFQNAVDLYDLVYLRMNSATATNIIIDTTLSSLPNLTKIEIRNGGTGLPMLVEDDTTINGNLAFIAQYEVKTLVKVGINEWDVVGVLP